jgi:hypothetical protein
MPRGADLFGLATAACATAALLLALPGVARLRRRYPMGTLLGALALSLAPLGALPPAGYVRGVVGDLSVTALLLLLRHLLRPALGLGPIDGRSRIALQSLAAAGGLLLYPLTLGFGPADPYRVGFADPRLVCALLLLAGGAFLARLHFVASCLALGVLAWAAGMGESRNLWDYVLDPIVAAWGAGALLARLARGLLEAPAAGRSAHHGDAPPM